MEWRALHAVERFGMVTLDNDDIKCIARFESLTGAVVEDIVLEPQRVTFLVRPGDMGRAIGKGGANVRRLRDEFHREIEIVENDAEWEPFMRNLFPGVVFQSIGKTDDNGQAVIHIRVPEKDRGAIIGRGGDKIKKARFLLRRKFKAELKLL